MFWILDESAILQGEMEECWQSGWTRLNYIAEWRDYLEA